MVRVVQKGDWKKTHQFLQRCAEFIDKNHYLAVLNKYGQMGVEALSAATPTDSGKTASSWGYRIDERMYKTHGSSFSIVWTNSNVVNSPNASHPVNVALILQYGHGTRNGGYVQGIDYINPAIQPIFDEMAEKIWEEIVRK